MEKEMKKLLSVTASLLCLFVFTLKSEASTETQTNEAISSAAIGSIASDILPKLSTIKTSLTALGQKNVFGKIPAAGKEVLIYQETGLELYLAASLKNYLPVIKLIVVVDDRAISKNSPDTVSGTLSFNIGYRWDGFITLTVDSDDQALITKTSDGSEKELVLKDVTLAIGVLPHNQGKVKASGVVLVDDFPVNIGLLSTIIDILSKTA